MRGQIVLPEFYRQRWTDDYKFLFKLCDERLGFKVEYTNEPKIKSDVIILFATPHHNRPGQFADLAKLPKDVRAIGFLKDIQTYGKPECIEHTKRMFDRFDIILSPSNEFFRERYPEYVDKMVYFPDFVGPRERYANIPFNEKPTNICFVSGALNPDVYPLRERIVKRGDKRRIAHLYPPWSGHDCYGDEYAKTLNRFVCCATCSSKYNYTLAKYFEIPASGALLIANTTKDYLSLGFEPHKHYVPISEENALHTINKVLDHPKDYTEIRKTAREYVLNNHTEENRFEQLRGLL